MNDLEDRWERALDPKVVIPSLLQATLFITTFEMLKDVIINRIRDYYSDTWMENSTLDETDYQREVAARNKSTLYASLEWLRENDVLDEGDLQAFNELKATRNQLTHRLFETVTGQIDSNHLVQFTSLVVLLRKIEVWWIVNIDLLATPALKDREINYDGVIPGTIISLQILIEVASGNTAPLEQWRQAQMNEVCEKR